MANSTVWQVQSTAGNIYDIEDRQARTDIAALQGKKHLLGFTTTKVTDGGTQSPVDITQDDGTSKSVVPEAGQYVIYGAGEYVWAGGAWHQFGDHSGQGALATKDSVSATYKPAGTNSAPAFTGNKLTMSTSVTPTGKVSAPAFTGTKATIATSGTPKGSVGISASAVPDKGTPTYTPAGNVAVTPTKATIKQVESVGTLPSLTTSVENGVLKFSFSQGSLPTTADASVMTGASAAFTGTGTMLNGSFTGQNTEFSGSYTPAGTVGTPQFTGDAANISVSGTPTGTVAAPVFTGTEVTITSK